MNYWKRKVKKKTRLQKLRFNHAVSPIENTNVLLKLRRDIARIKTELRAREIKNEA